MGKQKSAHWLGSKDEGRVENAECRIHKWQFREPHGEKVSKVKDGDRLDGG
jgi:nitrite reductase/ring-hydroxylating ferredoxin subunit